MPPKKSTICKDDINEILDAYLEKQKDKIMSDLTSVVRDVVKEELSELKRGLSHLGDVLDEHRTDIQSLNDKVSKLNDGLQRTNEQLNVSVIQLKTTIARLEEKQNDMDVYSRRSSLHFKGIQEVEEQENCEELVRDFIRNKLGLNPDDMKFERVHRIPLGPKKNFRFNRTITAKFLWFKDKDRVWRNRSKLKDFQGYFLEESFPANVERDRKVLLPILKAAKEENMKATLIADALIINGTKYKIKDLHRLPQKINPSQTSIRKVDDMLLYNSTTSPLGRTYPCSFTEKGKEFKSVSQYIAYSQAMEFQDENNANKIMMSTNPIACEKMGIKTNGFSEALWNMKDEAIMENGNLLKFQQNIHLKNALLTMQGISALVECNPYDTVYGNGFKISDINAGKADQWTGKNIGGKVLTKVRKILGDT